MRVYTWPKTIDLHGISALKSLHPQCAYLQGLYRFLLLDCTEADLSNPAIINPNNTAYSLDRPEFWVRPTATAYWLSLETAVAWGIIVDVQTTGAQLDPIIKRLTNPITDVYTLTRL